MPWVLCLECYDLQGSMRYKYFARQADVQGYPDAGNVFRALSIAEEELSMSLLECYHNRTESDFLSRELHEVGSTPLNIAAALQAAEEVCHSIFLRDHSCLTIPFCSN